MLPFLKILVFIFSVSKLEWIYIQTTYEWTNDFI